MSGLGTCENASSLYHEAKWAAECCLRESGLQYVIFRPSVIFGKEDDFLNQFEKISRFFPCIPVVGTGKYLLQPISVHDVAQCIVGSLENESALNQIIELGGPQKYTFNEILILLLKTLRRKRILLHIPFKILNIIVPMMQKIPSFPLSMDQLRMLANNNVTDNKLLHQIFKINLQTLGEGLKEYSWYPRILES